MHCIFVSCYRFLTVIFSPPPPHCSIPLLFCPHVSTGTWRSLFPVVLPPGMKCQIDSCDLRSQSSGICLENFISIGHSSRGLVSAPKPIETPKFCNVLVFVPLIFGPRWYYNQLNKNPNIAELGSLYRFCSSHGLAGGEDDFRALISGTSGGFPVARFPILVHLEASRKAIFGIQGSLLADT